MRVYNRALAEIAQERRERDRADRDYAEGYHEGIRWAEVDRTDGMPAAEELARLREEAQTEQRWARAFYLGALRGYREVTRTRLDGRWGT